MVFYELCSHDAHLKNVMCLVYDYFFILNSRGYKKWPYHHTFSTVIKKNVVAVIFLCPGQD